MKIQEIAALANVSTATVSRVFSHHPNVSREVRERVFAVARKYKYHPRLSGKQKNIVIIYPYRQLYPAAEFVEMVSSELIRELSDSGFRIEIIPHDNIDRLNGISFCGAIGIGIDPHPLWDEWHNVPLVVIDKVPSQRYPGVSFVHSDEPQGMEMAVKHLFECGCRKVGALLHGTAGVGNVNIRRDGFLAALKKYGFPTAATLVRACTTENFFEEMGKLLQNKVDGIFCGGGANFGGLAAYSLALYGRKIPNDVRLVSSERHRISRYCVPAQTTISPDYRELARQTVEHIRSVISGESSEKEITLPYSLIIREST